MSMDSLDPNSKRSFFRTFGYAIEGIWSALRTERNLKIHLTLSVIVLFLGLVYSINSIEWMFVLFAIAGVIVLELINTAIERVVDLVTTQYHPLAKQAKDIAAGAVFIYAILSVIIGLIIFFPKIF